MKNKGTQTLETDRLIPRQFRSDDAEFLDKQPLKVKLIKEIDANGAMNMIGRGGTGRCSFERTDYRSIKGTGSI